MAETQTVSGGDTESCDYAVVLLELFTSCDCIYASEEWKKSHPTATQKDATLTTLTWRTRPWNEIIYYRWSVVINYVAANLDTTQIQNSRLNAAS